MPVVGGALVRGLAVIRVRRFRGSEGYWEERYAGGGTSGSGSYGHLAAFKAEVLNRIVADRGAASVLELGCGDGSQLALASYPTYVGLDVAPTAVRLCPSTCSTTWWRSMRGSCTCATSSARAAASSPSTRWTRISLGSVAISCTAASLHRWRPTCPHGGSLTASTNPYPLDPARPDEGSLASFFLYELIGGRP